MGKCETTTASIGLKILLSDLVLQINETNFELIKQMLYDGCIEDKNDYYNETYKDIVGYGAKDNELPEHFLECQVFLINEFKKKGFYYKSKINNKVEQDTSKGCLFEKELLVPIKNILMTERWGYDRYGINSAARPLDFDLSVNADEYKDIEKFQLVFFLKQHSN